MAESRKKNTPQYIKFSFNYEGNLFKNKLFVSIPGGYITRVLNENGVLQIFLLNVTAGNSKIITLIYETPKDLCFVDSPDKNKPLRFIIPFLNIKKCKFKDVVCIKFKEFIVCALYREDVVCVCLVKGNVSDKFHIKSLYEYDIHEIDIYYDWEMVTLPSNNNTTTWSEWASNTLCSYLGL